MTGQLINPVSASRPAAVSLRVFVVGCARGGTTILQSCVSAHPRIHTFPESRLVRSAGAARGWARALGLATTTARERLRPIYAELGLDPSLCRARWFLRGHARDFAAAADRACLAAGKDVWLEKTPDHVRHTRALSRWVPGSRFLHILRDGFDNVCSLLDISRREPAWGALSLAQAFARWSGDAACSLAMAGAPGHLVLRLSDLTANPEAVLRAVDRFLGLEFHPDQLAGRGASALAVPVESWKSGLGGGVRPRDGDRYHDLLPAGERDWLRAAVAPVQARVDALPPVA
jgi:hypothetical protein